MLKKKKVKTRILICLQYWNIEGEEEGDYEQAMAVADIIAKLQTKKDPDVDFMFAPRYDSGEPDYDTFQRLKPRFGQVFTRRSERQAVGWPTGCNNLWHDSMMWCYRQVKEGKHNWDAILTMEGDSVPVARDWLQQLKAYWKAHHDEETLIMGHMIEHGIPHINGNALFSPWLNKVFPEAYGTPSHAAWDMYWAPKFNKVALDCPLIKSYWKTETINKADLFKERCEGIKPVFVHGVKDDSARAIVTKELL